MVNFGRERIFRSCFGKSCFEKWTVNETSVFFVNYYYYYYLRSVSRNTDKPVPGFARSKSSVLRYKVFQARTDTA